MKNLHLDVTSEGDAELERAIQIAWARCDSGEATYYKIARFYETTRYEGIPVTSHTTQWQEEPVKGTTTLVLLEGPAPGAVELPYPLDFLQTVEFVKGFLRRAEKDPEPGHDGDNQEGWRVFAGADDYLTTQAHYILSVQPVWAMYGK